MLFLPPDTVLPGRQGPRLLTSLRCHIYCIFLSPSTFKSVVCVTIWNTDYILQNDLVYFQPSSFKSMRQGTKDNSLPLVYSWICCLSRVRLFVTLRTVARWLIWPWDSPGKNTGVGCHFLLHYSWLAQCLKQCLTQRRCSVTSIAWIGNCYLYLLITVFICCYWPLLDSALWGSKRRLPTRKPESNDG